MLPVDPVVWRLPSFAGLDSAFITGQSLVVDGGAYDH
jgi:hypothetical protein